MYARDELAEVYPDLAPTPLLGLIDLVLTALETPDSAVLDSFRMKQSADGGRAGLLCPADLLDELTVLINPDFPAQTIQWHLRRALHVQLYFLEPRLQRHAGRVVTAHRSFIEAVAGPDLEAFLYVGLHIVRSAAPVLEHVRAWVDRDVEVARCIARSSKAFEFELGPEVVGRAASMAFTEILKGGVPAHGSPRTLVLSTAPAAADLLPWLSWLLREHPAALAHVHGVSLPEQIVADWPLTSAGDLDVGRPTPEDSSRRLFDFEDIRLPAAAEEAARMIIAIVRSHPSKGPALAGVLQDRYWRVRYSEDASPQDRPSDAAVVELAKLGPDFFRIIIEVGWLGALQDRADLVAAAAALDDFEARSLALRAIGRSARTQLGCLVDELLAAVAAEPDGPATRNGELLAKLADEVPDLGLPFWEKRLTRARAFKWLWQSARIREALTLHPEPVYRLIRRAAAKEPQVAVEALGVLVRSLDVFPLAPVAEEVVALVGPVDCTLAWSDRLRVLAHAGSAEAHAAALGIVSDDDIDVGDLNRAAAQDALTWSVSVGAGTSVGASQLVEALHDELTPVCAAAVAEVVDVILTHALVRPAPPAARRSRRTNTEILAALVRDHRASLDAARLDRALAALKDVLEPNEWSALAAPVREDRHGVPPLPWTHLFESDLGHVLPEIGRWFADRVTDPAWMRHDPGKVLRPAIVARYRDALGERGDEIIARLGERWPTQAAVVKVAEELGITVDAAAVARCADEAVPPIFRAALARLPLCIEDSEAVQWADEHWIVRWVFESVWPDAPGLLARHIVAVFEGATDTTWRRGLALALVALREPCGTTVPDALTAAARASASDGEKDFFKRQRDTFARESASRQQDIPGELRSREALHRLRRFAKQARGVR